MTKSAFECAIPNTKNDIYKMLITNAEMKRKENRCMHKIFNTCKVANKKKL